MANTNSISLKVWAKIVGAHYAQERVIHSKIQYMVVHCSVLQIVEKRRLGVQQQENGRVKYVGCIKYYPVVRTRCSTINYNKLDIVQQHGQIPNALSWIEKKKYYLCKLKTHIPTVSLKIHKNIHVFEITFQTYQVGTY